MGIAHALKAYSIGITPQTIIKFGEMMKEERAKIKESGKAKLFILKMIYEILIWPIGILDFEKNEEPKIFEAYKKIQES